MRVEKWFIFRPCRYGGVFAADYWTGEFTDANKPSVSKNTRNALPFETAREAYDFAGQHKKLNWFRVGRRVVE